MISLLMLDVDHFKSYNDAFGHTAGDEILKKLASILYNMARSTDIVARYGGEEFAVILPHTDRQGALAIGKKFQEAIAADNWPHRPITASIGLASLRFTLSATADSEGHIVNFINQADNALYHSKANGRDCITHYDDISAEND
jgi:diguanylate cyclase (GGDEF)-like protein